MKNVNLMGRIIMKILEVGHWVAVGLMTGVAVCAAVIPNFLKYFMDVEGLKQDGKMSLYGFEALVLNQAGEISRVTLVFYAVGAILLLSVMALVFRDVFGILKRSESGSPFQPDNIKALRRIGICSFSMPLIGILMSVVIRIANGAENAEISMDQSGLIMGVIVLCLTQFFIHGAQLEQDVEGLV